MSHRLSLRTQSGLVSELRGLITGRGREILADTQGTRWMLELGLGRDNAKLYSGPWWILNAQIGTLEKLQTLFGREGEYSTFELLGVARNLFENLIWLRLFNSDNRWGIVFYRHLLAQQQETTERMIAKLNAEADLFDEADAQDSKILEDTVIKVALEKGGEAERERARAAHDEMSAELDRKVRRSFALYAAAAAVNSYLYQAHVLRKTVIPEAEASLKTIADNIAELTPQLPVLLVEGRFLKVATSSWNWRQRAEEVGMGEQYSFLYSFTSKLLHATPLNLITEKTLSESEEMTLLEYCVVAVHDMFEVIGEFSFEGRINFRVVDIDAPADHFGEN